MATFSIKLNAEFERKIEELLNTGRYAHKCEIFLYGVNLLYDKVCIKPNLIVPEDFPATTTTDTSAPPPSGELKVTITTRDREPEEDEPTLSSYERLARVLGVYNGSYNPPV